jgi:hypothetical protein
MLEIIKNDLKKTYPPDVCDALIDSYAEIREQYYLGKHEPAELNGGKFAEACLRLVQQALTNSYTPIGIHIPNIPKVLSDFEHTDKTKNDSYRIHIPRALIAIYNIRNRRGVGHLGGDVNPNLSDSTLILAIADWVLAEIYRIVYAVQLDEAQRIINDLVKSKMLLVHKVGNIKRVLDPALTVKDQALLLLYNRMPESITDEELLVYIEYANKSYFRNGILKNLHRDRFIEYSADGKCSMLPPGVRYVENNYKTWIENINKGD